MGSWAANRKTFLAMSFLLTLLVSMVAGTQLGKAIGGSTITVPDDYPTIQAAVNAAGEGDTIFVKAGTYNESVIVNKSVSFVGESAGSTFVVGEGNTALLVQHDNVNVTGFTFRRPSTMRWYYGVHLLGVQHCNVFENKVESTFIGIWLVDASFNNVFENTLTGDWNGICLQNSFSNNISENEIRGTHDWGITAQGTHDNLILDNYISANGDGISLDGDSPNKNNLIAGNVVTQNNYRGIDISSSGSVGNQIVGNTVTANGFDAISIGWDSNLVFGNRLTGNQVGISLAGAQNNNITHNLIENNANGAIRIHGYPYKSSLLNVIYENNIINNAVVFSGNIQPNSWDYESRGNYWSAYSGSDSNNDGRGDTPYQLNTSNVDNYPLMAQVNIVFDIMEFLPGPVPQPSSSPSPLPSLSPTPSPSLSPLPSASPTQQSSPITSPTPLPSESSVSSPTPMQQPTQSQAIQPAGLSAENLYAVVIVAALIGAAVFVVFFKVVKRRVR